MWLACVFFSCKKTSAHFVFFFLVPFCLSRNTVVCNNERREKAEEKRKRRKRSERRERKKITHILGSDFSGGSYQQSKEKEERKKDRRKAKVGSPKNTRASLCSQAFIKMATLRNYRAPKMLLRLYSLIVLALDLTTLLIGIWFAIVMAFYRTFRPPSMKSIHGEVAVVIGSGRGVGREIAIQLAQLGVNVACVDIDPDGCQTTANRALQLSGTARAFTCDVTNKKQVFDTIQAIRTEFGDVTMLFHCCGVPSPRAVAEDPVEIKHIIDISVVSHFWLLDAVLPGMQRVGRGHIVVLSSVAGLSGGTSRGARIPLSTAQFAVQGFAESLQTELRHSNSNVIITLVHVYPFIIGVEASKDIRFRIPSYFGTMPASEAAKRILEGVRRNYAEFSVPGYLLYLGHLLRILPKKASFMLRDLLDTGVDFA